MNLSKDTSYVLAMLLDLKSLLNLCQADKRFYEWMKNENFWKDKMSKDYPFLLEFKKEESWRNFYFKMNYYIDKIEEKYDIPYIPVEEYNPINFFKENFDNEKAFNITMRNAAKGGCIEIVKLMLEKGATNFNQTMYSAAQEGYMDIVKLLIEKGATDFHWCIAYTAREGYMDIVKLLIEKGSTDFKWGIHWAKKGGHMDIEEYLKSQL